MSKKSQKQSKHNSFNYMLLPLIAYTFIPLILRVYILDDNLTQFKWYQPISADVDIFIWGKCIAIYIISSAMLLMLLFAIMNNLLETDKISFNGGKKELPTRWYIIVIFNSILILLSTIFSKWASFGFGTGYFESHENIWTLLCYFIVTIYSYMVINKERDISILQWPLLIMQYVVIAIGLLELKYGSIITIKPIVDALTPARYVGRFGDFVIGSHITSTLMNSNYVGVFVALFLPLSISLVFANKKIIAKVLWSINSSGLAFLVYIARNKTFIVVMFIVLLFFGIIVFIRLYKYNKIKAYIVAVIFFIATGIVAFVIKDRISFIIRSVLETSDIDYLDYLSFDEDGVHVSYKGNGITAGYEIVNEEINIWMQDEDGQNIDLCTNDLGETFSQDEKYDAYHFQIYAVDYKYNGAEVPYCVALFVNKDTGNNQINFIYNSLEEKYYYVATTMRVADDLKSTPIWLFEKKTRAISSRGLIWGKTLPLLPRYILLGAGAETFPMVYPNYDYVFRINTNYDSTIIQKPHNWYLQVWIQQGGLSLLCLLAILGIYFAESLRLYLRTTDNLFLCYVNLGIMLSVFGYCMMGITNDSVVVTAPMFWLMLGVGFAVNRIIKNSK